MASELIAAATATPPTSLPPSSASGRAISKRRLYLQSPSQAQVLHGRRSPLICPIRSSLAVTTSAPTLEVGGEPQVRSKQSFGEQVQKFSSTVLAFTATTLLTSTVVSDGVANSLESLGLGAGEVFRNTCSGCHAGGGNILQPGATLLKKDLEKNGLVTVDDIYNITYFGKNRMPGYGEKCMPRGQCTFGRRLSEEDIRALAEFVNVQANQGWTTTTN